MSYGGPQQQQYGDPGDYAQPSGQYGQPQQMWQQNQQPYGQAGAYPPQQGQYMQQPSAPPMHMQGQQYPQHGQQFMPQGPGFGMMPNGGDAFMTGLATDMLQQQSATYIQRGQAFMQQRMGFLSTDVMHYFFNLNSEYVRHKLLMLVAPFLRRWNYARVLEQISGGHKYLPPRQDVNAPDLYIPLMAAGTYCILMCLEAAQRHAFKPDLMTSAVSTASVAWFINAVILKLLLHLMGIPSAIPFLEVVAYAGYAFVHVCITTILGAAFGRLTWYVMWGYGSLCMAIFIVRTIKRIIFHEARQYRVNTSTHNYVLLGLALFQFLLTYVLGIRPAVVVAAARQAGKAAAAGAAAARTVVKP
mmetsp:Transcript_16093/g.48203  ORF Transcript_16093/g.48203 Transcript_16093/m.48203 type:complete len:358 (-) Transcript_16093:1579-2652(-)